MSSYKTVTVKTQSHDYPIYIGSNLGGSWKEWLQDYKKIVVLIDSNVASLWQEKVTTYLENTEAEYHFVIIPAGEASKSLGLFETVSRKLISSGIDRYTAIMAVGGGVTGDLAGFIAATLLRGVPFIQVPTTLLAQVDSSVGGKTAVNVPEGKNLIGAFYPPHLVIIDTDFLSTLPEREMKAGYAEVLKYGLIYDPSFLQDLYQGMGLAVLSKDQPALSSAIETSCRVKAEIVSQDEHEKGIRAILNLGHTFGHVFEADLNYDGRIVHGEAVAIGMVMAMRLSVQLGMIAQNDVENCLAHYKACQLPTKLADILKREDQKIFTADSYLKSMYKDKKVKHGVLTLILLEAMGRAVQKHDVDEQTLLSFLQQELS